MENNRAMTSMRALQFLASFLAIFANFDGFVLGLDPRVINVSAADLVSHLQPVVRAASVRHNVSFAVGVRTAFSGACIFKRIGSYLLVISLVQVGMM